MDRNRLAVFDFGDGELRARGLSRAGAVRHAIAGGLGAYAVQDLGDGLWGLMAGPGPDLLEPTGFRITARDAEEAERGCLAAASVRRHWGGCSIVRDDEVSGLLALSGG